MPEDSSIEVPSPPPPPPPRARKGGGAKVMFVVLIVLALAGIIVYLLSLLNSKKFFLMPEGGELVVKKGIFFPVGSEIYMPKEPELANLYKPIEVPDELRHAGAIEFPDLPSLNREFAKYLIRFAKEMIFSDDDVRYQRGKSYLARSKRLEGLDLEQQETIRGLMADVDYIEAKRSYAGVERTLEHALKMFKRAETFGTGRFADAHEWIQKIEVLLQAIRTTKAAGVPKLEPEPVPEPPPPPRKPRPKPRPKPKPRPAPVAPEPEPTPPPPPPPAEGI
jgi:hypothetical protein